jgi:hypothetical protein
MKWFHWVLLSGLVLSMIAKVLQAESPIWGNVLAFPAVTCLVIAAVCIFPAVQRALANQGTRLSAVWLIVVISLAVACFQAFSLLTFVYENDSGFYWLIPFGGLTAAAIRMGFRIRQSLPKIT